MKANRKILARIAVIATFLLVCSIMPATYSQDSEIVPGHESSAEIAKVIAAFSAKETQFRKALNDYGFRRDAVIQTIGMGGQSITGEYHRVSFFTFDDNGNRFEKINFFPQPTLFGIQFTQEDLEDLGGIQPYALEAAKINQYDFKYLGKQKIDEITTYVFDVNPKVMPSPKRPEDRMYTGRIWVDDQDLQIVKVKGKGVPETKDNKYPVFETWRNQVDGKYWFPVYTYADDDLNFSSGTVHIRMKVTYSDYKKGRSTVRITEANGDELDTGPQPKPTPAPSPKKP